MEEGHLCDKTQTREETESSYKENKIKYPISGAGGSEVDPEKTAGELSDQLSLLKDIPDIYNYFSDFQKIGSGTFSTVYRAKPLPCSEYRCKYVALKCIYESSSAKRIINEASFLHELRDVPSVVKLYSMLRFGQLNILVLEYVEHEKDEYIYTMSVVQCQTYMKSLFTVLSHLEKRGIVHRDLKPQNFLYHRETKKSTLIDFGLSHKDGLHHLQRLSFPNEHSYGLTSTSSYPEYYKRRDQPSRVRKTSQSFNIPDTLRARVTNFTGKKSTSDTCHSSSTSNGCLKTCSSSCKSYTASSGGNFNDSNKMIGSNNKIQKRIKKPLKIPVTIGKCGFLLNDERPPPTIQNAGTRGYRSPEQLIPGETITTAADVWAAGIILFCIASGRYPYYSEANEEIFDMIRLLGPVAFEEASNDLNVSFSYTFPGLQFEKNSPLALKKKCEYIRKCEKLLFIDYPLEMYDLLYCCLQISPKKRIKASQALQHNFLIQNYNERSSQSF